MVKVELTSSSVRDELLNKKRIIVNYITYDIIEYLAPANVLICSTCMALGYFKKQCTQIKETCRTCGDQVEDMKNHKCSNVEKCVHCGRNHKSSSLKCPVVKSFRAELTRKILQIDNQSSPDSRLLNKNVIFNSTNFPPPPAPKSSTLLLNPMMVKLDELINKLSKVKDRLDKFEAKHDKFEQFISDKNRNDETIIQNMNDMSNNYMILKKDVVQQNLFIERHENLFCKLLIPMLEDVFTFISAKNQNQKGNPLDADLKCRINRYFIQMKKATEAKANVSLSSFDFNLLSEILSEWEDSLFLDSCLSLWHNYVTLHKNSFHSSLHVLSFNVRGLELRWQEVLLLISSFNFDILILLETGNIELPFFQKIFNNFKMFYQKGENKNGGVLVLLKLDIQVTRIECKLPNVCILDIKGEEVLRIAGVYAPESKSWTWDDLSQFLSRKCVVFGDFNVDIDHDASGLSIDIQIYNGNTTSDHTPIISVIPTKIKNKTVWFWSKCRKYLKPSSSYVHAFITPSGNVVKNNKEMCEVAADFYENFFKKSNIVKPHPYTDSPLVDYDNVEELIPEVKLNELILTVRTKRKKKSLDAHGISNFMFNFLEQDHWSLLLKLFNHSFQTSIMPRAWKDTRMVLLAKKEPICSPSLTRPISLIDSFLKVCEKLFVSRFRDVLFRRGLLPDDQSGFRDGFRLQTRLLLFFVFVSKLVYCYSWRI
ncbi:unnamed protein product [Rotaria magnacalcarata]|uniref:Reverse transcriptase domain-containing protein n=3 Tax=Rotaria magnacalcarata TaxID=392030 RepID=A0A815Q1E4_9BILA|nr:unnamed protein product [Rotaria magnacalcarata]